MILTLVVWVVAMIAGLRWWPRWAVAGSTAATVAAGLGALWGDPAGRLQPAAWVQIVAMGIAPWLLMAQRQRYEHRRRRLQAREAYQVTRLQEMDRALRQLEELNVRAESAIGRITDLYYVSKETGRTMRREELCAAALDILPKLLPVKGLSLVDAIGAPAAAPTAQRTWRTPEGRFQPEPLEQRLAPAEQAVLERSMKSGEPGVLDAVALGAQAPPGVSRIAWATLRSERRPIGALIGYDATPAQQEMLTIIANQLSLQLSRVHLYETLETMAVTDALTGMSVRRYGMERAAEELQRAARHDLAASFIMVDLDVFKAKNDTYGHLVGDAVLRDVARLMLQNLREVDLALRYGGEEFLLVLVETGPSQAMPVAERLRQLIEVQPIRAFDETLQQTVSMGLACFPEDGRELSELIERADQALYAAKRAGRNQVVRWTADLAAQFAGQRGGVL